ncbi:MAG: heterocyst frequency control protein PatD [Stenomitos frigidus ULC029]
MDTLVEKEERALPPIQQQRYKAFQQALQHMHQMVLLPDVNNIALRSEVTNLQQLFRDQLLSLPMDAFSSTTQHWVQAHQVEIDKQLRLLGMDLLFLQGARQVATALQRRQQVCDRLDTLQRYCEALLGGAESDVTGEQRQDEQGKF